MTSSTRRAKSWTVTSRFKGYQFMN